MIVPPDETNECPFKLTAASAVKVKVRPVGTVTSLDNVTDVNHCSLEVRVPLVVV